MLSITSLTHSFTRSCVHRDEKYIQHNNSCVPNSPLDGDDDDDVQLEAMTSFEKCEIIDNLSSATDRLDCRYGDIFKDFPPFYSIIMIMRMSKLFADAWSQSSPNFKSPSQIHSTCSRKIMHGLQIMQVIHLKGN